MDARAGSSAALPSTAVAAQADVSVGRALLDVVQLAKPRITAMVVITGFGGMWLAQRTGAIEAIAWPRAVAALIGLVLVVSGANALNMYAERDSDKLMTRTANRPLPAGRMAPRLALSLGLLWSLASLPVLALWVNMLTTVLAATALLLYVVAYTPLKRVTSAALLVGAVPGAMPPLLGWTAMTGTVGRPGVALFAVLFFWQLPHFIAIATFRREEYERAGIRVLTSERGDRQARLQALGYTVILVATSLMLIPLGVGGSIYAFTAVTLGLLFLVVAARGLSDRVSGEEAGMRWARQLFFVSLVYLTLLIGSLVVG